MKQETPCKLRLANEVSLEARDFSHGSFTNIGNDVSAQQNRLFDFCQTSTEIHITEKIGVRVLGVSVKSSRFTQSPTRIHSHPGLFEARGVLASLQLLEPIRRLDCERLIVE